MQLYFVRIISLIVIALVFMLFDVLNKRNVPSLFAYGTLAYGFILTLLYFDTKTIGLSIGASLIVLGIGYIAYRIGQLGAADVIEFATLSLILPVQQAPLLVSSALQFNLPFVISLVINTGIVALIMVPIYYLPKARAKLKKPLLSYVTKSDIFTSILLIIVYVAFIAFTILIIGFNYIGATILVLLLASSLLVMLFSKPITYAMVEYVDFKHFDEGDIIALNLMSKKSVDSIRKKIKDFDRLLTSNMIKKIKDKKIREKFPVYKEAVPFALPIFIAVILSLLVGNLLLFVLGI